VSVAASRGRLDSRILKIPRRQSRLSSVYRSGCSFAPSQTRWVTTAWINYSQGSNLYGFVAIVSVKSCECLPARQSSCLAPWSIRKGFQLSVSSTTLHFTTVVSCLHYVSSSCSPLSTPSRGPYARSALPPRHACDSKQECSPVFSGCLAFAALTLGTPLRRHAIISLELSLYLPFLSMWPVSASSCRRWRLSRLVEAPCKPVRLKPRSYCVTRSP